jgi:hypothetical protein
MILTAAEDTVGSHMQLGTVLLVLAVFALIGVLVWAVNEHTAVRGAIASRDEWRLGYWHLMATAKCPLCGSRMEPEPTPAPGGVDRDAGR